MHKITRRRILKSASITASAAALSSLARSEPSNPVSTAMVAFTYLDPLQGRVDSGAPRKGDVGDPRVQGVIPRLLQTHVGPNSSVRGKQYTYGGVMQFKDRYALAAYVKDPAHQALLRWLVPLIDAEEIDIPE